MDPEKIRQPNPDWPWMMEVGGQSSGGRRPPRQAGSGVAES